MYLTHSLTYVSHTLSHRCISHTLSQIYLTHSLTDVSHTLSYTGTSTGADEVDLL